MVLYNVGIVDMRVRFSQSALDHKVVYARVAQQIEQLASNKKVVGAIPTLGTDFSTKSIWC